MGGDRERGVAERLVAELSQARGEQLSGESLAAGLGVTRAAVWKAVRRLREQGYRIEAEAARGYRLRSSPDLITATEVERHLGASRFGRELVYRPILGSTNDEAARLAAAGAPEGMVVVADAQTAGRGRLGRSWHSPAGRNLYASWILRPPLPPQTAAELTLTAGVAAAEAIAETCGLATGIKWPNDVWVGGRKIAGVLMEMRAEADRVHFVVAGIGVNVNATGSDFPAGLRATATSIRIETGGKASRAALLAALCGKLEEWYRRLLGEGFPPVAEAFRRRSVLAGAEVRVEGPGEPIEGRAEDIDDEGRLIVRIAGGGSKRVLAGDVQLCRSRREPCCS